MAGCGASFGPDLSDFLLAFVFLRSGTVAGALSARLGLRARGGLAKLAGVATSGGLALAAASAGLLVGATAGLSATGVREFGFLFAFDVGEIVIYALLAL
jgi:hypothetical protein